MFEAWLRTVFSAMPSSTAISLLLLPRARDRITSSSRLVRGGASSDPLASSKAPSILLAMEGAIIVSPA